MILEQNIDNCLERLRFRSDLAVAVSRQYALNQRIISQSKLFCFDETQNVENYLVSMYIRQGRLDNIELSTYLRRVLESGLIVKWHRDSRIAYQYDYEDFTKMVNQLTMSHLYGGLFMYGLCLSIAFGAFVIERIAFRRSRQTNSHWLWKWVAMFIDTDRHLLVFNK